MRHITAIDQCVGRVLDALESTATAEDTIVIVASDNGYYLGEHELGDKRTAYEESMRVPCWFVFRQDCQTRYHQRRDGAQHRLRTDDPRLCRRSIRFPEPKAAACGPLASGEQPDDWRKAFFYEYFKEPQFHVTHGVLPSAPTRRS